MKKKFFFGFSQSHSPVYVNFKIFERRLVIYTTFCLAIQKLDINLEKQTYQGTFYITVMHMNTVIVIYRMILKENEYI